MQDTRVQQYFSGIGGKRQDSLGICILLLGLGLVGVKSVELGFDLIGGQGSLCPGLLPLHVLIIWKSAILCGVLPHDDGINDCVFH